MFHRLINNLVNILTRFYSKLPLKPFQGYLKKLYEKYATSDRDRVVVARVKGITYELNLNELIDRSIYFKGCFEPMATAVMYKYVKFGMTVLDIGANIGCHTLLYAKLVGRSGKVIAFEPMKWAIAKLKRNMELNDFSNIIVEKVALSDVNDKRSVYFRSSYTLDDDSAPESEVNEDVNFMTLDTYVESRRLNKIDFIKLDVDGFESKVIRGGLKTIRKFKPVIIMELGKYTLTEHGDSAERLIDLLSGVGYSFYSERDLHRYSNKQSLLDAIPDKNTINVVCKQ
jgi:FkbM family methyltransferase